MKFFDRRNATTETVNVPETRHRHGELGHDHPGGNVPHDHAPLPAPAPDGGPAPWPQSSSSSAPKPKSSAWQEYETGAAERRQKIQKRQDANATDRENWQQDRADRHAAAQTSGQYW